MNTYPRTATRNAKGQLTVGTYTEDPAKAKQFAAAREAANGGGEDDGEGVLTEAEKAGIDDLT